MTHKKNLSNVTFVPRQDKKNMKNLWSICDVSLISLKNTKLFSTVIPSKIFESMALQKPIIMGVEGESKQIIKDANCGIFIEPQNHLDLVKVISKYRNDKNYLFTLGKNGYNHLTQYYSREVLAKKMMSKISSAINTNENK